MLPGPTPTQTPYDITEIPVFAYVPAPLTWLALLSGGALAAFLAYHLALGIKRRSERLSAYGALRRELAALKDRLQHNEFLNKSSAAHVSALVRRYVTLRGSIAVWQMSPSELQRAIEALPPGNLRQLLEGSAILEQCKYAPQEDTIIPRQALTQLEELAGAYEAELYLAEHLKKAKRAQGRL